MVINLAVSVVVNIFSFYERHPTRSGREKWLVLKLSVFYLVNSLVVPILAGGTSKKMVQNWYSRGGLIEQAFYIQVSNAFIPDLLTLFNPAERLNVYVFSKFARTQKALNNLLKPPSFFLAERYAANVKTLGLAICYMPALPLSPFIALLGLTFSYITDKIVALRRAQRPNQLNGEVIILINRLLRLLPLAQMVLMFQFYFQHHEWARPVFWTGFAVWCLFSVVPIGTLCKWEVATKFGDWGTGNAPFVDTIGRYARPTQNQEMNDLMKAFLLPEVMQGDQNLAKLEVYEPACPAVCGSAFEQKVIYHFNLPAQPYPANPTLLEGQKQSTGGEALTQPPARKSSVLVATLSPGSSEIVQAAKEALAAMEGGLEKQGSSGMLTHRYPVVGPEAYTPWLKLGPAPVGHEHKSATSALVQSQGAPPTLPDVPYTIANPYAPAAGVRAREVSAAGPAAAQATMFPAVIHYH